MAVLNNCCWKLAYLRSAGATMYGWKSKYGGMEVGEAQRLTSRHFLGWCEERKIQLIHIQPGRPMQNGHREKISRWRGEYNSERPHSSLGYRTPNEFAETLRSSLLHG
jgi:putative transposase